MPDTRPDHLTWRHRVLVLAFALALVRAGAAALPDPGRGPRALRAEAALLRSGASVVTAPRGPILDATGYPLAISVDTWDLYLDSLPLARPRARDHGRNRARRRARLEADALFAIGTAQQAGDVLVQRRLPYEQGLAIQRLALWGVRTLPSSVREYPEGDLAHQLWGFVGLDANGLWGIEADYDHVLRGRDGLIVSEPTPTPIAFAPPLKRAPATGREVHITLDRFVQAIVERELDAALTEYGAPSGSIVVMDPRSGAILALASRPTASPQDAGLDGEQLAALVRNRAVTDLYEPGSVFKTLTTAAAIDLGLVGPDTLYEDRGRVEVGGYTISNWDFQSYGLVTVREYLQRSLNTGAVWLSGEIGARRFYEYMLDFGIGEPTHVGLSGEAEGMMRTPDDDEWYPVDLATNAFGQGLATTPLQLLAAVSVFANDGVLMRPYMVSRVVSDGETRAFEPVAVRQVVSPATARTVARLMLDVVEGVPWHGARVDGYRVAGKTGTTIVSIPTGYDFDTTIASFVGFLPYESPRVAVLVKIDQPGGELNLGGQVAAPVFARVAAAIMEYLNVPSNQSQAAAR